MRETKINTLLGAVLSLLATFGLTYSATAQPHAPILFNSMTQSNGTVVTPAQVYVVNPDGSNLRQLTAANTSSVGAAWHPGYQYISFFRDGSLCVMEAAPESNRVRPFVVGSAQPIGADFSPDGKRIAYCGPRPADGKGVCMIVRTVDLAKKKVGTPTVVWQQDCYAPSFSPDGTKIAFSSHYSSSMELPFGPHIKILDLATGAVTSFDSMLGYIPSWNADGNWIAFCGSVSAGQGEVFMVSADFSQLVQVTALGDSRGVAWPSFSPAGDELVFTAGYPIHGNNALYKVSLNSGLATLFKPLANAAHWAP